MCSFFIPIRIVSESRIYFILRTCKPKAKAFKRWVTREIIPSIRKNGAYMTENTLEKAISVGQSIFI
ncbi:hypothetical protein bcgnr5371_40100 [Bacillus cereus]